MDDQQPSTSGLAEKNKNSQGKVFQLSWLKNNTFKSWLKSDNNNKKAFCTACNKVLVCGKTELIRHSRTQSHIKNASKSCDIAPSVSLPNVATNSDLKHAKKVKIAEIKLAAFTAEQNIAFQTADHMLLLLKKTSSDPQVVKDLKLSRTTCTQIIKNVIDKRESDKLIAELKIQKFSILIHESTTISNDKLLCILVKYVSTKNKECITELLELINLDARDCSADKLYSAFKNCLESKNIPVSNIVGMACDNTSVMTGIKDSFVSRLKKEVPALIVLKCICHSSVLIASKACSKLPDSCENLLHSVATYFSGSAKRSAILREFQEFFEVESRKILKLSGTKWLVLQKCVVRLLDNWEVLKHYFHLETLENKNNSAASISQSLNDCEIKAFMLFLKYSLHSFNDFDALFKGREILIHKLAGTSERLIKQIGSNFLLPHAIKNINENCIDEENFLPLNSVYVGPECETFLQTQTGQFISNIKSKCLRFYITAFEEMVKRLPYNEEIFRDLKFLDASIALREESRLAFPDLSNVAKYFQICDLTALAYEWRMLPIVFDDENKSLLADLEIDKMWKTIFEKKNFNEEKLFPNLEILVQAVLSLPHSNAEAERLFSIVPDVKNKKRNRIDAATLNTVCKIRCSFLPNNIDSRSFQVDSQHL